jgi:pimeloyl-ACP methyl ester carboxylesterase
MLNVEPWTHPAAPKGAVRLAYRAGGDERGGGGRGWAIWWPAARPGACAVYLHGHGSGGDQPFVRDDVRRLWLPELRRLGLAVLSPHLGATHWMAPWAVEELHRLIGWARSELAVERFHFVAGSMGGTAALIYAVCHPLDVSSLAALCPATDVGRYHDWRRDCLADGPDEIREAIVEAYGGTPADLPEVYVAHSALAHAERLTMPLLVVHGADDAAIPADESRRLAAAMTGDRDFTYVEIPGGDHDAPISYAGIWPWLAERV